jgi:hypothetical protein
LLYIHLADDDFIGGIQNITFPSISVAEFDNGSIACTEFMVLEDKLAFEEVECFNISLLPLGIGEEFLVAFGENTSAIVEISDNDCKIHRFYPLPRVFLSLHPSLLSLSLPLSYTSSLPFISQW